MSGSKSQGRSSSLSAIGRRSRRSLLNGRVSYQFNQRVQFAAWVVLRRIVGKLRADVLPHYAEAVIELDRETSDLRRCSPTVQPVGDMGVIRRAVLVPCSRV